MPESRIRRKAAYTAPTSGSGTAAKVNGRWFVPVMVGLMVLGLVWIVVFYLTQGAYPIPQVGGWSPGNWNLVAGFALVLAGFAMTTRWR